MILTKRSPIQIPILRKEDPIELAQSPKEMEIFWFRKEEFPKVCSSLKDSLLELMDFIKNESNDENELEDPRVVKFKSGNEMLSGTIMLNGWNISQADISIRYAVPNRQTTRAKIDDMCPWKLDQIQSIYYYCKEALEQLDDILSSYPSEEITLQISNMILDQILHKLRLAKDQLLKPSNNTSVESNFNRKIFKNNLPQDLVVDFKIKNQVIVVTSTLLSSSQICVKSPTSSPSNSPITHKVSSRKLTSSSKSKYKSLKSALSKRQSQSIEILEQNTVECRPKKLDDLCKLLQNTYLLALSCKEKNIVLQSLEYIRDE